MPNENLRLERSSTTTFSAVYWLKKQTYGKICKRHNLLKEVKAPYLVLIKVQRNFFV